MLFVTQCNHCGRDAFYSLVPDLRLPSSWRFFPDRTPAWCRHCSSYVNVGHNLHNSFLFPVPPGFAPRLLPPTP